jgi:hypothetical protein
MYLADWSLDVILIDRRPPVFTSLPTEGLVGAVLLICTRIGMGSPSDEITQPFNACRLRRTSRSPGRLGW